MKTLILYYSQAVGNTEKIANMLKEKLDADIEKIDTVIPYTGSSQEISSQGQDEVERGYKPEIKFINSNVSNYDRVVIATPTWWYTMAPAVLTLLSQIDLSGKDVVLVQTHAGWPGHCLKDMESMLKEANIVSKKDIKFDSNGGTEMETPVSEIENWINSL